MKNVLRITTSILGEGSVSSELMDDLLVKLSARESFDVTERNFTDEAIPHLDGPWLNALSTAEEDRSAEQQAKVAFSDTLIAELLEADTLVIALPMYNFSVPSMLKAWVDHIARAGVTFKYTENGAVGLLEDKKVYLVATMGGMHEAGVSDFLRPFMKQIMAFIGLNDVQFITADGLNMGPERREQGIAKARNEIANSVNASLEEVAA